LVFKIPCQHTRKKYRRVLATPLANPYPVESIATATESADKFVVPSLH
jgi:hypothetical protein